MLCQSDLFIVLLYNFFFFFTNVSCHLDEVVAFEAIPIVKADVGVHRSSITL